MSPKPKSMSSKQNKASQSNRDTSKSSSKSQRKQAHTRSEIENALAGQTSRARTKRKQRSDSLKDIDLSTPPRRQQVIGGKLGGVSNRAKFGIFSRYNDISVVNWAAGVVIILLISAAFFWPQSNNATQEVAGSGVTLSPEIGETDLSKQEQADFLESENSASGFSRDDDIQRASDFRAQDALELQIRSLITQAELQIKKGHYTQPENANANQTYRSILALDPRNIKAKEGIQYIIDRFSKSGFTALRQNNLSVAQSALKKLLLINQQADEAKKLTIAISEWKVKDRIDGLVKKGNSALAKGDLILPANRNALHFYRQVLIEDGDHRAATEGVQNIADTFIQQANDAVLEGQYEAASAHLATVSIIDPENSSIALVEAMIARAKPLAEQAREAQLQAELQAQLDQVREEELRKSQEASNSENAISSTQTSNTSPTGTAQNTKTPKQQTAEQETFDRQYLKQGLEAYYQGEYDTSAALLQPLADKGIARAQFRLAYMHYLGRGFKRDRTIADKMIRAALPAIQRFADDGRAWAQSDLGSLYEDGLVLPKNYTDAVYWYRSAAEQGYPGAQTNLGIMYARGQGVTTNRKTAIEWFQRAANQGDSVAKRNLEAMGVN